ncbi:hypothetical protein [Inquilinus sp. CA228]|uniref:hypothetical protein n=1 Tax=Inquilinus sp. CA228 TaxID=3455609 RepID=UPI003F8D8EBB
MSCVAVELVVAPLAYQGVISPEAMDLVIMIIAVQGIAAFRRPKREHDADCAVDTFIVDAPVQPQARSHVAWVMAMEKVHRILSQRPLIHTSSPRFVVPEHSLRGHQNQAKFADQTTSDREHV